MATSRSTKTKKVTRPLLSIVVPVYNEKDNFEKLYRTVTATVKTPHRLLVVYDFDEDNTLPIARKIAKKDPNVLLVKNTLGRGALNAIKAGLHAVKHGPVLVTMADLADDLNVVDEMVACYQQGAQLVCGSRYMKGGKQVGGPLLKRILSRVAGNSLYYVRRLPTHDVTNNFKLYDKAMLEHIPIESRGGFEVAMEITIKAYLKGARIVEIPAAWYDRTAGTSNFKLWQWLPSYLKWYLHAFRPRRREWQE